MLPSKDVVEQLQPYKDGDRFSLDLSAHWNIVSYHDNSACSYEFCKLQNEFIGNAASMYIYLTKLSD